MKTVLIILCMVFVFMLGHASGSRADTFAGLAGLSIEQLMEIEVVTTASRFEQKVTEAPSSVSITTAEDIKRYGYRNLADILRSVRGFYITYDRNYSYAGVRGFGRPGDWGSRILFLIDGHRFNEPIFESFGLGLNDFIDVDLVARVEVARGPSSSIYGGNAFFAVINVITKKAEEFKGAEVSCEYGSFGAYKTRLTYGNKFQNDLEAVISGSYYNSKGNSRLYFREYDDPAMNNGVAADMDHSQARSLMGKLSSGDFTLQSAYVRGKKQVPTASYGTVFNDNRFFTIDESFFADLKYERSLADDLSVMARLNYNVYNYYGEYPFAYAADGQSPDIVINRDEAYGKWWGAELQINKRFSERHRLIIGGEYRDNIQQQQKNYDTAALYMDDDINSDIYAVYAQDELELFQKLVLNMGLRHDHYSNFGSTTNPRIALIYNPAERTTFKLLYGTAFRPPNVYELYFQSPGYKLNPDLKPETIKTYELVYEQYIGNHYRGSLSVFYNRIKDLINQTVDPADEQMVYKNSGEAEAKGMEFELEGKWESGVTGRVSYMYQAAKDKYTGEILSNSPRHLAKANLVLPLIGQKAFLGIEEQYTSERKTVRQNKAKAFYLTNLTVFSRDIFKDLEASASVYNLFDKKYADPAGEELVQDTIEQDGRSFRVKATYRF